MASHDYDHLRFHCQCNMICGKRHTQMTQKGRNPYLYKEEFTLILITVWMNVCGIMSLSQGQDIFTDYINTFVNCFKMDTDDMLVLYTYHKYLYFLEWSVANHPQYPLLSSQILWFAPFYNLLVYSSDEWLKRISLLLF